jgi:hypothetical protein
MTGVRMLRPTMTVTAAGPCPPDEAWDRYVRPRRWPEWSPQIRAVEYPGERLTAGTSGVVRGPGRVPVRFRILSVDESDPARRRWTWSVRAAGVVLRLDHLVEPRTGAGGEQPRGSRTTLTVHGWAPVVVAYLPLAWLALRRLVR